MKNQNEIMQNAMKVGKRIAITILCCIPFLIAFAYLTRDVIKNNALQILIFVLFMGFVVLIEEIIVRNREKRKKAKAQLENNKDVFK